MANTKQATSLRNTVGKVTRQMSPNPPAPVVAAHVSQPVADFLSAYSDKKKIIDNLTGKFVDKAGEAKQAQDAILPHLADMQSGPVRDAFFCLLLSNVAA